MPEFARATRRPLSCSSAMASRRDGRETPRRSDSSRSDGRRSPALVRLFASHDEALFDALDFRRDLEGLAAHRAARLASDTDLQLINTIFEKMQAAHDKRASADEARLDAEFHLAIIEASHNVVLLHMMRSIYDMLKDGVFYNRQVVFDQRNRRSSLLDQHRAINDALLERDPEKAQKAVHAHLDFVRASLTDKLRADRNEANAQKRLQQEEER